MNSVHTASTTDISPIDSQRNENKKKLHSVPSFNTNKVESNSVQITDHREAVLDAMKRTG